MATGRGGEGPWCRRWARAVLPAAVAAALLVAAATPAAAATRRARRAVPGDAAPGWSCEPLGAAATALRSAAEAAIARRWNDTRAQLGVAEDRVRVVSETAPLKVARRLTPLDVELRDLQQQAASSNPVDARQLRVLAGRVGHVRATCPRGRS